jgi:hypothetical protein
MRAIAKSWISAALMCLAPTAHASDEFYGIVESMPPGFYGIWIVGGVQIEVTDATRIKEKDGPLAPGACAEVELEHGYVEEIESEDHRKCIR